MKGWDIFYIFFYRYVGIGEKGILCDIQKTYDLIASLRSAIKTGG